MNETHGLGFVSSFIVPPSSFVGHSPLATVIPVTSCSPGRGGSSGLNIHRRFLDRPDNPADSKIACICTAFLRITYLRSAIKPVNGRRSEASARGLAGSRASLRSRECRAEIDPFQTIRKSVGGLGGRHARLNLQMAYNRAVRQTPWIDQFRRGMKNRLKQLQRDPPVGDWPILNK
jgi:hypothetical protein